MAYTNRPEPIETPDTSLDLILLVASWTSRTMPVSRDMVMLLRDLEDVDMGDMIGDVLMLNTVVLLRFDTVVDLGRDVTCFWPSMEPRVDRFSGVGMIGLDATDS
jgi:hypothetical protein